MRYDKIVSALCGECWAIMPEKMEAIIGVLQIRVDGGAIPAEVIEAAKAQKSARVAAVNGDVAVIPMLGVLTQRMDMFSEMSGGSSTEAIGRMLDGAVNDPAIGAVLFDVDSPGGSVFGIQELSDKIFEARKKKPIYAVANSMSASGSFWLASAADKFFAAPGGQVGSVGVIAVHTEASKLEDGIGVKRTIIKAGRYKAEGNPYEPLPDDAKADWQDRVDEYYDAFVSALARNRGTSMARVKSDFGQGRVVSAQKAVDAGMIDGIATFSQVLGMLTGTIRKSKADSAEADNGLQRRKLAMAAVD